MQWVDIFSNMINDGVISSGLSVRDGMFWFCFQSDTPYRRSFTVLDNIGQGRPGRASVGTGQKINSLLK